LIWSVLFLLVDLCGVVCLTNCLTGNHGIGQSVLRGWWFLFIPIPLLIIGTIGVRGALVGVCRRSGVVVGRFHGEAFNERSHRILRLHDCFRVTHPIHMNEVVVVLSSQSRNYSYLLWYPLSLPLNFFMI